MTASAEGAHAVVRDGRRRRVLRLLIAAALAVVVGFVSAKYLAQGTALVSVPWGVIALLLGAFSPTRRQALLVGAVFGFLVSYAYLWFDDTSALTPAKAAQLALLIMAPAAFGLLCGAAAAWVGRFLAGVVVRRRRR
jgi:hypothetical protein